MRTSSLPLVAVAVAAFGLALGAAAEDADTLDAAGRVHRFRDECRGSAVATKRRLLEDLRADLYGSTTRFQGAVWSLASVSLTGSGGDGLEGASLTTWEYDGLKLPPAGTTTAADLVADRFPGAREATLVILRSGDLQLYGLAVERTLVDQLRRGATVSVLFEATGLRETSLAGIVTGVEATPAELVCPEGHRFEAATGYRFCPFCGTQLAPAAAGSSSSPTTTPGTSSSTAR